MTTAGRGSLQLVDNDNDKDSEDPFVQSASDKGPRQMLEVFLKSAPFLKVMALLDGTFFAGGRLH